MKNAMRMLLCLVSLHLAAQDSEIIAVQKTIETFFDGFHRQDSIEIKKAVSNDVVMQTIVQEEPGKAQVKNQAFSDFLKAIVGRPETTKFEEIIKAYSIQIDGPMANAWTPYEFKIDDKFHHCGVNSFQLVKNKEEWKIIYIIDTRRKNGCDNQTKRP